MSCIQPRFPATGTIPYPAHFPSPGGLSSKLSRRFWYYVHEYILLPISGLYFRYYKNSNDVAIYPLPFGFVLKRHQRVCENECLGMELARAMGIPAPKCISYGSLDTAPEAWLWSSVVMTRVPGTPMNLLKPESIDYNIIKEDLIKILTRMRSFANPWGRRICGVAGSRIYGPMIPDAPMPACNNEAEFQDFIRNIAGFAHRTGSEFERVQEGEKFFAMPEHAIVFTHGDLNPDNIMIGPDGHISGIFDWEAAGWLPEYWEISVTGVVGSPWGQMMEEVASRVYEQEVLGHRAIFPLVSDTFHNYY